MIRMIDRCRASMRRLAGDRGGLAITEFAFAAPLFATLGLVGLEAMNLALANMRVSQVALNLADTTSRLGETDTLGRKVISEGDIEDAFLAVKHQVGTMPILTNGRVILSSVERNMNNGHWIHWQRCYGNDTTLTSSYGVQNAGASGLGYAGMGPTGQEVTAPDSAQAVMFVEVAYRYQPLVTTRIFGANRVIRTTAAFLVRDPRDLTDANNPKDTTGVTERTC
jgi:Flp pilus assembly protein TadG